MEASPQTRLEACGKRLDGCGKKLDGCAKGQDGYKPVFIGCLGLEGGWRKVWNGCGRKVDRYGLREDSFRERLGRKR